MRTTIQRAAAQALVSTRDNYGLNNAEALHAFLTIVPELVEIRSNLDGRTNRAKDFDTLLTKARELRDLSDRYFAQWREMEIVKR